MGLISKTLDYLAMTILGSIAVLLLLVLGIGYAGYVPLVFGGFALLAVVFWSIFRILGILE